MKRIDEFVEKLNFKRAIKIYLVVALLLIIVCAAVTVYISRDKLNMAFNYKKVSNSFREKGVDDNLKNQLNKLVETTSDIKNALIVDKNNEIVYKAKNYLIKNNKSFVLAPYGYYNNYLQDNINKNVIYKVVKDRDIILDKDYIENHKQIENDIDEFFSFEKDLGSNSIYLLNYMVDRETGNKLFIIREVSSIPYLEGMLKITLLVLGVFFAIYWIGLALWVYKDANKRNKSASLWGLLVLITNVVGLIIYIMYKQNSILCYTCGTIQSKENRYCSNCGVKINNTCNKCGNIVNNGDNYCKNCGEKLKDR